MPEAIKCADASCQRAACALVGSTSLCRAHLIAWCYERLEECRRELAARSATAIGEELLRRTLSTCTSAATAEMFSSKDLTNLERARLFDIVLSAAESIRRLRRSKRKAAAIPVRLSCEIIGRTWTEDTQTRIISFHGACVQCAHAVKVGDTLRIERPEARLHAACRVAWRESQPDGKSDVGIEFTEPIDFWQMDWNILDAQIAAP